MKNRLEELRKQRGIKQEDLASALEVSRQTIGSLENDIYVDPRHPAVFILTRKLKVSTIVTLLLGVLFLLSGLVLLVSYFPVWCLMIG